MEIRLGSIDFSLPLSGSGPRVSSQTVVFPRTVVTATAGLSGYTAAYSGDDHHVGRLQVELDTSINDNTVTVTGTFGLRDWSGNWDDEYDGAIDFVVLADLQSATAPTPRGDLIVTGMELNQAVQFFRAASYLDPANVSPDNSIWLVARKTTGVRVYADWDSSAGLPPITNLTGNLIVETPSTTLTLDPINPGQSITPRRDSQINMAVPDHTLNFSIPAVWCVGTVTVSCQLWDKASPGSKSATFTRTLVFTPVNPLSLYLVGVNYTAVNPALQAPTQSAISSSLSQLVKTYPVGDIIQTGYTTIQFAETVTGNVANGCGNGFSDLLNRLNDLRGSSSDIYLGSLPAGIVGTPGNSIGGCAPQGGAVAGVFVDVPSDVPHEIGHCLNRHHAPCTVSPGHACSPPPADPDSHYPQYNSFPSDSIGVYGFDSTTDTVFNPSSTFDFMAYSFPQWVSAYTYSGLRGSNFGGTGGPTPGAGMHLRNDVEIETLFLSLTISRERKVDRRVAFHYQAPPLSRFGCSEFTAEFLDADRNPLLCWPLHCDCNRFGCGCWPRATFDQVPFPLDARWIVVWEDEKKIYEEEIPDPPVVKIVSAVTQPEGTMLTWEGEPVQKKDTLWYLVHWYDENSDSWRGVAPRQLETSLLIPRNLFVDKPELRVRVLASPGIATGLAETVVKLEDYQPGNPQIGLTGVDTKAKGPTSIRNVISVVVIDSAGRQLPTDRTTWHGNKGVELARGSQLDLRQLTLGRHLVRSVVRGLTGRTIARSWLIERTRNGFALINEVCDPVPKRTGQEHEHPHPAPEPCK